MKTEDPPPPVERPAEILTTDIIKKLKRKIKNVLTFGRGGVPAIGCFLNRFFLCQFFCIPGYKCMFYATHFYLSPIFLKMSLTLIAEAVDKHFF